MCAARTCVHQLNISPLRRTYSWCVMEVCLPFLGWLGIFTPAISHLKGQVLHPMYVLPRKHRTIFTGISINVKVLYQDYDKWTENNAFCCSVETIKSLPNYSSTPVPYSVGLLESRSPRSKLKSAERMNRRVPVPYFFYSILMHNNTE